MVSLPIGVSLVTASDTIHLSTWLDAATKHRLMKGTRGFGMPPVEQAWAAGAGDGEVLQGERLTAREITLPLAIKGNDRQAVRDQYGRLAKMLAPGVNPTLRVSEPSGATWGTVVSRAGGGDYDWGTTTDGRTIVTTEIVLRAGVPYWTAVNAVTVPLAVGDTGRGLLPDLAELALVSSSAGGSAVVENAGNAPALPQWRLTGPVDRFKATGPNGDVLEWDGSLDSVHGVLASGDTMVLDTRTGTVIDGLGQNRFRGMTTAPRFWQLPSGTRTVQVEADGTDANTRIDLVYYPRAWVVF